MPRKKKRKSSGWDEDISKEDLLSELEEELENINAMFEELRDRLLGDGFDESPYVYGYSVKIDPEGQADIIEFGEIPTIVSGESVEICEEDYFSEVIKRRNEVVVMMEVPGAEKEDIKIKVTEKTCEIEVRTNQVNYKKKISLPCAVRAETAKASCKNGVLELCIKRRKSRKKPVDVNID